MDVKTFKVIGGEEIVCNVMVETSNFVIATDVVVLQVVRDPKTGEQMQAFGNWPALAKLGQEIKIPVSALLTFPVEAHEELARQYISNVTGLELPPVTPKILLS